MSNIKKVKLGEYEVEANKKANPYAILSVAGILLPMLCKELKIAVKSVTKTSKRGNEYTMHVAKTKANVGRVNRLRNRIQWSIVAEYSEKNEAKGIVDDEGKGYVINDDLFKLGKVKAIPASLRSRIDTDTDDKKVTAKVTKKTATKTQKVSAQVLSKGLSYPDEDSQKFTMSEVKEMAKLKSVSVATYVKFLKLEGHTVVA